MSPAPAPRQSPRSPAGPRRRGGFTLLELLIVIAVIAVLIALLVPAVRSAVGTANDAAVRSEISGMEAALAQFHQEYGRMPPSFLDLRRSPAGFANATTMPTLRNLFGVSVDEAAMVTSLNNMGFPGQYAAAPGPAEFDEGGVLRGAECLVFFLGGLPANGDVSGGANSGNPTTELAGFSKNPRDPFSATIAGSNFTLLDKNRRTGPFFEFVPDRLRRPSEVGGAGSLSYFTYVDRLAGQQTPLLYTDSDGGRGYPRQTAVPALGTYPDLNYQVGVFVNGLPPGVPAMKYGPYQAEDGSVMNPRGYQIISPGIDGAFGIGGTYSTDDNLTLPSPPPSGLPPVEVTTAGDDNITNFASGTLGG